MTDKDAMKLALFALDIVKIHYTQSRHINEAIIALKERLAPPEQEPTPEIKYKMIVIDDLHPQGIPVEQWVNPPQRTEQNFCSRCGKRTPDLTHIHTCTPPPREGT